MNSFTNLEKPIIYLITKGNLTKNNFQTESHKTLAKIKKAILNNITLIQIREKGLTAKLQFELVTQTLKLARASKTKVLVNERIDIAMAANADGVHLTSNSLPTSVVRDFTPDNFLIGVSTHTLEKAEMAKIESANFATFSPIFPTSSKQNYDQPKGISELKKVCDGLSPFPIIALGGINKKNCRSTIENGASGFAGISFFE